MSEENREMNATTSEAISSDDLNNKSTTVVGIETQSVLEVNESESHVNLNDEFGSVQNLHPSSSGDSDSGEVSIDSFDNSGDEGIGDIMDDPECSAPVPPPRPSISRPLEQLDQHDSAPKIKVAVVDEFSFPEDTKAEFDEENSADTLTPLMLDNHVLIKHVESLKKSKEVVKNSMESEGEDEAVESSDQDSSSVSTMKHMKHSNTCDSISSNENNTESLQQIDQYDYRNMSSNDDNNKDSSGEAVNKSSSEDEQPIEIPDDDFCEQIVEQVEFYFSDESLLKDAFLLKHVRRNKEGFVSLKLVSSFKRVRALVKDWRVVGIAIKRKSKKIELNDVETKIRRLEPLPLYDETTPSRTVVATNLPFDKLTIEKISDIFSKCGEIALVRILRPNCPIPADVRQFVNKHPELQQNECALVEFTESSSARRAQKMDDIIVFELVLPKKKTGKKTVTKMIEGNKFTSESENERSRGGENVNNRYLLKRNNSGTYYPPSPSNFQFPPTPRKMSLGNEQAVYSPPFNQFHQQQYYEIPPRRLSAVCGQILSNERRYSNCSDGYSTCSEALSRRGSDVQRRLSNFSELQAPPLPLPRRGSMTCAEHCSCGSRRGSGFSTDSYRRLSNGSISDFSRRFSSGSSSFGDRKYSSASTSTAPDSRRISFDTGFERKISSGSMNYERKYSSNGFDPLRKLSQSNDYYINGRKVSTDSGYDRRTSINSITYDNENPITRSRTNSLNCPNHGNNEPFIRKPLGPDPEGGKGFGMRARKIGFVPQTNIVSTT
ncbi:CLUMA_CG009704, isoform A [Clunio marinus]|uniref:CLUMA_CG009704, isoform A n=1 Tax=Clunio marinus TaxID=568069 RepID=A0A1J1I974_9DIPT|nr:CLUMA_CG009704, isoform A [Clunio marinus]